MSPDALSRRARASTASWVARASGVNSRASSCAATISSDSGTLNLTNTGTKFRVQDIPQELLSIADTVIDYGLRKYHTYQRSATLINFDTLEVVRKGACYELIGDVLARHFGVSIPPA